MFAARQMRLLVLAVCLGYHASDAFAAFASSTSISNGGGIQKADRISMFQVNAAVPRGGVGLDKFGILRRARGGEAIWRRKSASTSLETPGGDASQAFNTQEDPLKPAAAKVGLLASYIRALDKNPMPTKVITSGVICGVGDIIAQALAFKTAAAETFTLGAFVRAIEPQRFGIYAFLGAFWIAPIVHYWFDWLESVTKGKGGPPKTFAGTMGKALKMVALDQTIGAPVVNAGFMFLFSSLTALCTGSTFANAGNKAASMVRKNIVSTMFVCWKLWPVANLINFAFVPANLRVLFMNFVGLGWNIYLSAAVN